MKKILILLAVFFTTQVAISQSKPLDESAILQSIDAVIEDTAKVNIILKPLGKIEEKSPLLTLKIYQKLLAQARKTNDYWGESDALSKLGYTYRMMGNTVKSLEYALESVRIANTTSDTVLIANCTRTLAHNYKDQGQHAKAIELYAWAEKRGEEKKAYFDQGLALSNLGEVYFNLNKMDSALMYSQRSYDLLTLAKPKEFPPMILTNLGKAHSKLGHTDLAVSYFKMAIELAIDGNQTRFLSVSHLGLANHYYENQQLDSASHYAKKAIADVQNTSYSNMTMKPAKLLSTIYESTNNDSTLKYLRIYISANDSLYSAKNIQQTQLLSFESELKQQELEAEREAQMDQRNQSIQFAIIGFSIISFIIIFLLLSRSFITNTRLISFLGVVALLIVFEFLNLLLHPFLERVTHHSPVLMLLALVSIAAMLVPLHNRMEKWATHKLVEKNKQIRLAEAKRTIEKLGNDKND